MPRPHWAGYFLRPLRVRAQGGILGVSPVPGRVDPRTTGKSSKTGNMDPVPLCFGCVFPYFFHILGGGGLTGWDPDKKRIKK